MNILTLLKKDHTEVKQIIRKLQKEDKPSGRENLFQELKNNLLAHSKAEDQVLYTQFANEESTLSLALKGREEHEIVERLLKKLDALVTSEDEARWSTTLNVFRETLMHHIEEEEDEFFAKAKKRFTTEELKDMGTELQEQKSRILSQPQEHPEEFGEQEAISA